MDAAEFLLYLCGCRRVGGHFLATGSRWILQRRASTNLLASGGFLRNLGFRGVEGGKVFDSFEVALMNHEGRWLS